MTVNAAFTARTTNGVSSGYALTGQVAIVQVEADSVMGGAAITVEACSVDTTGKYTPCNFTGTLTSAGLVAVPLIAGYYVRARLSGASATTSVNVTITT